MSGRFDISTWLYKHEHAMWNTQGMRYMDVSHAATSGSLVKPIGHGKDRAVVINRGVPTVGTKEDSNEEG